jgi:hypothetical protein
LFDRAVVHMLREGILLPAGIGTLTRLISEVRRAEHARLYRTLAKRAGPELRARLAGLLQVPADRRVSELERLRTAPTRASGPGDGGGVASGGRDRRAGRRAGAGGEAVGAGSLWAGVSIRGRQGRVLLGPVPGGLG